MMKHGLPVLVCRHCGIERQQVALSEAGYRDFYARDYYGGVYSHTDEQSAGVAEKRIAAQCERLRGTILAVGCGNGPFLQDCPGRGQAAAWQEVAPGGAQARGTK